MISLADAIIAENLEQVTDLLRFGADVNIIDEYGFTPLIEATIMNNTKIAKLLIDQGADANLQDMMGSTALHWAVENNNINLSQLLLEHQANPNAYNLAGQPVLVMPMLREQHDLKALLLKYGANLLFTQDFINAKLLGHMFELVGTAHIIDPKNDFVEIDFEGFFLEFSISLISESLRQFKNHYAARRLRRYVGLIEIILNAFHRASMLIKYQQYRIDIKKYKAQIDPLIQQEPFIIPVGYEGHAITFIKWGNILVKCDRREESRLYDNVVFYRINRMRAFSTDLVKKIIYEKQPGEFINIELHHVLDLQPITELKVEAQLSGNCSWANVEACIPALFFLSLSQSQDFDENLTKYKNLALNFFHQWREWNKDRALQFCTQSFQHGDPVRKVCKAEILAAILFQRCDYRNPNDEHRIESILAVLTHPDYKYILENYVRIYCYESLSEEGKNFSRLLKEYGYLDS